MKYLLPALAFCFPFLYFFRFVYPNSSLLVLGNDFGWLYYVYKAYLADSIAHGHFPLWSPAEAAGYGFFGNPFAAPIYPLNVVPILIRLLVGNYNYWFHQIFTVFGVSLFSLGLYRWLKQVFEKPGAALFTAVTLSACWSMGEFMRFPNAIHTIAWVPWVLAALHGAYRSPRLRSVYGGIAALVCEITAGYPYFVVYSFMLYAGYCLYLHWVGTRSGWRPRAVRQFAIIAIPPLLTFPYTSAVSQLMAVTTDRGGGRFAFATDYQFGPIDLLGSLVFPPVTSMEGCFYAGILTVFLLLLYFWKGQDSREKIAILAALMGFMAIITNSRSYFFAPLWTVLPVFNQMRAFSRMTIILLPVLAIAIHQGIVLLNEQIAKKSAERDVSPRFVGIVFATILTIQIGLYAVRGSFNTDYLTMMAVNFPPGWREIDFLVYTVFTFGVILLILHVDFSRFLRGREIVLAILLVLVTQDAGNQGRFLWARELATVLEENDIDPSQRTLKQAWKLAKKKAEFWHLVTDYFKLDRTSSLLALAAEGLTKVPMQNFDFDSYYGFYGKAQQTPDELNRLMGQQKLFFHARLDTGLTEFLADADASSAQASTPLVRYFDGNELRLEITNDTSGYLSWIDNFDRGWSAQLDGAGVAIERVMGTFKAVKIQERGKHTVRFVYRPVIPASAYAVLSLGLLALGGLIWWSLRQRKRNPNPSTL